ncbi:putative ABC transport system substrate-binding protein [Bradyrhizobium japonicum]|uniref:ABC transporter substrate-binding protein n=1 Tax=Bradyrhizobium japonicum TaxID=375 RepID=UPI002166F6FE|nr:ABC transporter substrate-binding protein [Bradyrhizobium japonicum]MCS3495582.1 putative ABC transport system substrate-binding protein [Bradyrhizobium japonicum]MCS3962256.1 putative ABC transport system substrate-binding protein [Bradyrhizobium japonicum]MCS3994573.1 putative ABC transport system substrate-binding protein [Bradyrhizobium japonicum]
MKRRKFITLVGAASTFPWFTAARSQVSRRSYRIAVLADDRVLSDPDGKPVWRAFSEELVAGGFVEGSNLQVDRRGFGQADQLDTMAIELVRTRPDVVFALAPAAGHAAQRATRSIPIVVLADDLVTSGLVGSMSRPDGNLTGVSIFAFHLDVKRLELLHEALPNARRIGILAETDRSFDALERAARLLGVEIMMFKAGANKEVTDAIDAMKAKSIDAVNVLASAKLWSIHSLIIERLALHRIPSIWQWPQGAEDGGLIAYGPRLDGVLRLCGRQIVRLLRGTKAADVPVEQPTELVLGINLRAARALGVGIPPTLLSRADKVLD